LWVVGQPRLHRKILFKKTIISRNNPSIHLYENGEINWHGRILISGFYPVDMLHSAHKKSRWELSFC
jgi:hypothetical protein